MSESMKFGERPPFPKPFRYVRGYRGFLPRKSAPGRKRAEKRGAAILVRVARALDRRVEGLINTGWQPPSITELPVARARRSAFDMRRCQRPGVRSQPPASLLGWHLGEALSREALRAVPPTPGLLRVSPSLLRLS